ncbi:MAG TPA: hypothetical protein VF678_01280 [bacterium]
MSDFLNHLLSPVTPQAAEHAHHHGGMADVALHAAGPVAAAVALGVGVAAVWWLLRRLQPRRHAPLALRLATGALIALMLLAVPLLAVHATHHADGDAEGRCAVAGIAHSVHAGMVATPPVLAPLVGEAVPFPPYLRADAERLPLAPIARGPPVAITA